ncbi:chromosome partitioning protein [Solirubrobacter pauli]|uniref:Chromosome partitioning protein n=1 Tax=Solirubrobacter pauli TaxID=166793 RepID=A0A660L888_9ACTN|nr:ParA family protein [Solirubrobacter pauli]RKQ90475.1 chromosome partitioning protein [Solirubrobacter pauli]
MPARTITISQQKGGVGKSTTVVELACAWGVHGVVPRNVAPIKPGASRKEPRRVLVIDLDPQAGATAKLGVNPEEIAPEQSVMAVLEDPHHPIENSLWAGVYPGYGIDLIPGHFELEGTEAELARRQGAFSILRDKLAAVAEQYEYVLIDSRPSLGLLTINALFACSEVLIPVKLIDTECTNGVRAVLGALADVAEHGGELQLLGALATFHDARKQTVADAIRTYVSGNLGVPFLQTVIPDRSQFGNAALEGSPVNLWRPNTDGASSYRRLAAEIAEHAPEIAYAA